jgi:hypothetical protein
MKTTFKNILVKAMGLLTTSILLLGCDSGNEFENNANSSVELNLSGEIIQMSPNSLIVDENSSNMYSRMDSIVQYGFGAAYSLPDSLKDCNLKLLISGRMRETESITGYLAISLNNKDSILYWGNVMANKYIQQINTWVQFKDSVFIPKTNNKSSTQFLKIFSRKYDGKGYYDVDDLIVKIIRE